MRVAVAARPEGVAWKRLLATARGEVWWEHKLAPIAATGYASAHVAHVRPLAVADRLALVLVALAIVAVFASVLNDLTDRAVDCRAGKPNRLEGRSARFCAVALAVPVVAGAAVATVVWRHHPVSLGLYAGTYLAFVLYSVPPFRLKNHGAMGVAADATGAQLLPSLLVVAAVFDAAGRPLDLAWCAAVAGWAAALGIRGVTWHQLSDADADARAGVRTLGVRRPELARRFVLYVAFPVELLAFALMLGLAHAALAAVLVPTDLLFERRRTRRRHEHLIVVVPAKRYRIAMQEYYVGLYGPTLLVAAAVGAPAQALLLMVHVLAFPRKLCGFASDAVREFRSLLPRHVGMKA
jgi:hypothetical protein